MLYAGYFLTAGGFIVVGIGQLLGWQYGSVSYSGVSAKYVDAVDETVHTLRILDIVFGILFILLGLFSLLVWSRFKSYRRNAPSSTNLLYGGFIAFYVIWYGIAIPLIATNSTFKSAFTTFDYLGLHQSVLSVVPIVFPIIILVAMIVVIALNSSYFKSDRQNYIH